MLYKIRNFHFTRYLFPIDSEPNNNIVKKCSAFVNHTHTVIKVARTVKTICSKNVLKLSATSSKPRNKCQSLLINVHANSAAKKDKTYLISVIIHLYTRNL